MKCGGGGLNHKNQQRYTCYTNKICSQVPEDRYQVVAASLWPVANVAGAELHCIYKEDLLRVWSVWGGLYHKN
jgi:hypothetical protein